MRAIVTAVPLWAVGLHQALAQQTNPAPPIPESGPSGSRSAAATAAATDVNRVWTSLPIARAVPGLWFVLRRRQSGPPR